MKISFGFERSLIAAIAAGVSINLVGCGMNTHVIGREASAPGAVKRATTPTASEQPVQILVKFKTRLEMREMTSFRTTYGLRNVGTIANLGVFIEEITSSRGVNDVLRDLQASPLVAYAELNGNISIAE